MRKITPHDVAVMAKLGLSMRPDDAPLTVIALARLVADLQARVAELERAQRSPVRRFVDRIAEAVR
jgi:hypothetical protein